MTIRLVGCLIDILRQLQLILWLLKTCRQHFSVNVWIVKWRPLKDKLSSSGYSVKRYFPGYIYFY